ncbi:MAG: DUF2794 domain-containing protein [Proteobacteria bacterium]|nr:DUF2794 domain-containing protein [Pseudomonadota bacterium]
MDLDTSVEHRSGGQETGQVIRFPGAAAKANIAFNRSELAEILNLYGRHVAEGEWRDYAMEFGREAAVFAIFRRASEQPLYRIVKTPANARKQGQYSVLAQGGLILKRGHELAQVLRVLVKKPKLADG